MSKALQLAPIVKWIKEVCPDGQLYSDSREIKPESDPVFFAYEGDSADGRNYIAKAIENGAKAIVNHRILTGIRNGKCHILA